VTISGRPLLDNVMDAALFVGREPELTAMAAAIQADLNVALVGDAGIGKTSVLRTLAYRLRSSAPDTDLRYVRVEGTTSRAELIGQVAAEVIGRAYEPTTSIDDTLQALRRYRQELTANYRARPRADGTEAAVLRVVIVVDDLGASAGQELFGRLRDELWTLGYRWLVALRSSERAALSPPADAFFERVIDLGPLDNADAIELIERRQLWPPGWSAQVAGAIEGNPRRLLSTARDQLDERDGLSGLRQRIQAIAALGRPAQMLAAELDGVGEASASDSALLARLGWTRARATQVFAQLHDAGLVQSSEHKQGQGRPKRVFRLTPPEQSR
jgi:hypothetical protein